MGLQTNLRLSFDELSCSTDSKNNSFQVYDGDSTSMCPSFGRPVNKLFTEDQDQIVFFKLILKNCFCDHNEVMVSIFKPKPAMTR